MNSLPSKCHVGCSTFHFMRVSSWGLVMLRCKQLKSGPLNRGPLVQLHFSKCQLPRQNYGQQRPVFREAVPLVYVWAAVPSNHIRTAVLRVLPSWAAMPRVRV